MKRDLYAQVSARIVAELEAGAAPWIKPWSATSGANTPCNAVTNRPYSGCNVILLWMARAAGYRTPRFLTFKQAVDLGGHVRRGERGTKVYFVKQLEISEGTDEAPARLIPMMREYTVFNVDQCDGLPDSVTTGKPMRAHAPPPRKSKVRPRARFTRADRAAVLRESLDPDTPDPEQLTGEALAFHRPQIPAAVLRRLRRGRDLRAVKRECFPGELLGVCRVGVETLAQHRGPIGTRETRARTDLRLARGRCMRAQGPDTAHRVPEQPRLLGFLVPLVIIRYGRHAHAPPPVVGFQYSQQAPVLRTQSRDQ